MIQNPDLQFRITSMIQLLYIQSLHVKSHQAIMEILQEPILRPVI